MRGDAKSELSMDEQIVDMTVHRELQATTSGEFIGVLVQTFLDEAPGILTARHKAHRDGDPEDFKRAAHSLKSNGNIFGALARRKTPANAR
jgi:histidine phosphotransfer protein HptB